MTVLDQIKERVAYYVGLWQREPNETFQHIETLLTFYGSAERIKTPLVTCKDCKHATMSTQGYCKYCDRLCANDDGWPDFQVNFDADFFCGYAEPRKEKA